jgi:predicted nucleotide-binding protein (sugar kinase/HSP70/actin superfamily)
MPTSADQRLRRTIYIPYMSDHAHAMEAAFRACGFDAEVLPESDEQTLYWGKKYSSGKECFPFICTTGDIVKKTKSPDFVPERAAFFMPTAHGPCRFGQYCQLHRLILDKLGLPQTMILSPDSKDSYSNIKGLNLDFQIRGWLGILATDILEKLARETRPYELIPGQTDRIYRECLGLIARAIQGKRTALPGTMKVVRRKFAEIPIDRRDRKPIIGIVGEIYIRSNRFSNNNVVAKVEALGGEAWVAPISEWVFYTNYMYLAHSRDRGLRFDSLKAWLKDRVQKWMELFLARPFHHMLLNAEEPDTETILGYSSPYMHPSFGGEAILSIGKAIDYIKRGASGIINTMPFTCMPGLVVTAISKKFREDFNNIPWLNIAYDGQEENTAMTRLEAFMYQAKEYQRWTQGQVKPLH